jgi:antitoxin component YwqK of YwqJK toxin-antitoxin module
MKFSIFLPTLLLLTCIISCKNQTNVAAAGDLNLNGFTQINVPNSDVILVTKKSQDGKMLEQGFVRNGQKNGSWTIFHENESIKSMTNYVNGVLNGAYLEFNNRGQLEKRVEYLNNQFEGLYGEYKYGRPLKEISYENGIQQGPFRIWNDMGKLTQKGQNKNGKLDGTLEYYNDDEELIMKYEYKNGEVESGGMVN